MSSNDNSDFIVAMVALVVSVVALMATFMQVLQQYYASAQGYTQCNEKVMGDWAKTKRRRFQWAELRFEVQFDAPVIFVSPPKNESGPVPDEEIFFLDGTEDSLKKSCTTLDMDWRKEYKRKTPKERVHTADNERASWFVLLYAVQRMEAKAREWQDGEYVLLGPPGEDNLPRQAPSLKEHHTLTVAIQRKRKSWDTMPVSVTKPYATTTMCHLIEMMASLGIYWKEFDRKRDRYWGEGNGFTILGSRLSDLGLMFSFMVYGQCTFERNRVIPVDEIKELCFGYVPTIYREKLDQRRLKPPSDEQQNLSSLQMGSSREIAETLTLIGCNNNTVRYFLDDGKRTSHLFPLTFEILGMLSRTFHIENSSFTFIPNPNPDIWDKRSVSLPMMLEAFLDKVQQNDSAASKRNPVLVRRFKDHIEVIMRHQHEKTSRDRLLRLNALHLAIDDTDEILTAKTKKAQRSVVDDDATEKLPGEILDAKRQNLRREMVQEVLRHHIQEVVRLLNQNEEQISDSQSIHLDVAPSPTAQNFPPIAPPSRFEDMNAAGPDERQEIFMDVYFDVVRKLVVEHATRTTNRRASLVGGPPGFRPGAASIRSSASIQSHSYINGLVPNRTETPANDNSTLHTPGHHHETAGDKNVHSVAVIEDDLQTPLAELEVFHDDIWCTLVFRMICWLMLHDFNKKDVQVPKSELLGSRMPVYIA